jgi:hypothetical protein
MALLKRHFAAPQGASAWFPALRLLFFLSVRAVLKKVWKYAIVLKMETEGGSGMGKSAQTDIKEEKSKGDPALLDHIGKIIKLSQSEKIKRSKFFAVARPHINAVREKFHLTAMQALFFAYFIDQSDDRSITLQDIAKPLKLSKITMLKYMDDIDEMIAKKIIRHSKNKYHMLDADDVESYYVPSNVILAVRKNKEFIPESNTNITIEQFFETLESLFNQRTDCEIAYCDLIAEINILLSENKHLAISSNIGKYKLGSEDTILLLRFCDLLINEDDDYVGAHNMEGVYERSVTLRRLWRSLQTDRHPLVELKLLEPINSDGIGDPDYFRLTEKAKEDLISGLDLPKKQAQNGKDMIKAESITQKNMFYNDKENVQIKRLADLLVCENFKAVEKRLGTNGMRTGFACIFSGAPGTGKTETAYQIARKTKRNIMRVNIAETKSMWFGESEKKIKELFDRYRALVDEAETEGFNTPILLFNEADAVIGKRRDINASSVAQTENTIQNIILQEIENLKGILIATTNLTENMDKAFERRFLYKIHFEKPSHAARISIWQSLIPTLHESDAAKLAKRFDFSGGQIENIARKRTVDSILNGEDPNLDLMINYCDEERLGKADTHIGFK